MMIQAGGIKSLLLRVALTKKISAPDDPADKKARYSFSPLPAQVINIKQHHILVKIN